ncbi:FixH family protein [Bacillus sp. T33-2]|uniref:FixH family protein n=1 Tax=Bacillus sp. T33-2 TaxID=2054168 RepID=UPI0015E0B79D|nr:FixH family protein [Bacillus sp. T33-2]
MKKSKYLLILMLLLLIAACSSKKDEPDKASSNEEAPAMVEVEIRLSPSELKPNEDITIEAVVSQNGKAVEDADEVKFEIAKAGNAQHEMVDGSHRGKGVYAISKRLEEGTYKITAHVTARDMHTMPSKEITVGNPIQPAEESSHEESHDSNHDHGSSHEHGHSQLSIEFPKEAAYQVNKDATLVAHITSGSEPLTEAEVSFEIWQEGQQKHEYVDAAEAGKGEYKVAKTFSSPGLYNITIHVKKAEIHDHLEETITVK